MRTTVLLVTTSLIGLFTACRGQQEAAAGDAPNGTSSTTGTPPSGGAGPAQQGRVHTFGSAEDTVFFRLERTPCFGACPSYRVVIAKDGRAWYEGRRFAPREGAFTGQVTSETMGLLVDRADAIGFFGYKDLYDGEVTDLPSTIIRVNADGKDKTVKGRYKSPTEFKPFALYADSLLNGVTWTPVAAKP